MWIGLTGTKASGKGVLAEMLKQKGFSYFSLSDEVRKEAVKQGLTEYTIFDLQNIGNKLRHDWGYGVLAKRVIDSANGQINCVFDGIRNLEEVKTFRNYSSDFSLIAVDADQEIRYHRLLGRNRASDPKTWEEFLRMDSIDLGDGQSANGQQVRQCIAVADYKIFNNRDKKEFELKLNELLEKLKC